MRRELRPVGINVPHEMYFKDLADAPAPAVTESPCARCGQYAASDTGCTRCAADDSEYAERSTR
jgi:hypothetical protein